MKKVYEYLYGKGMGLTDDSPIPKDGNLMVLAINSMMDKGDWKKFKMFAESEIEETMTDEEWLNNANDYSLVLFGKPAKFFELFEVWLNENNNVGN